MKANNGMKLTPQLRNALVSKRLSLGLSYTALGKFLGVSWATVRKWELGEIDYCHRQHQVLIREFLRGNYDENFHNAMDAKNVGAYIREMPIDTVECIQRLKNCYKILKTRPDLQNKLLHDAFCAVNQTINQLLNIQETQFPAPPSLGKKISSEE